MNYSKAAIPVCIAALTALVSTATADDKRNHREVVHANLIGPNEVPAVSTKATGQFRAEIDEDSQIITYTLSYDGLEGGDPPLFSHIHLGERHTNGGVMVFLCGGGSKPACPAQPAEVTGTIVPSDVLSLPTQELPAGAFDELLDALRTPGLAYVNVHTTNSPGGEIRGQVLRTPNR
jgi:hypothetical protein